jgi:hypothetical protein
MPAASAAFSPASSPPLSLAQAARDAISIITVHTRISATLAFLLAKEDSI